MQREEFDLRVRMLLPQASEAALESYALLAEDPEVEETMGCSTFYDSLYVDLALVKRDHGEIVATDLFNYADFYTFNPFELRGAARLIADGWEIPEIANGVPAFSASPMASTSSLSNSSADRVFGTILTGTSSNTALASLRM